jgi:hypothetical protein
MLKVFPCTKSSQQPKSYALNSQKEQLSMQPTQCGIKIDVMFGRTKKLELEILNNVSTTRSKHRGCISSKSHIEDAIAALQAKTAWANMAWEQRAGIFLNWRTIPS